MKKNITIVAAGNPKKVTAAAVKNADLAVNIPDNKIPVPENFIESMRAIAAPDMKLGLGEKEKKK